MINEVWVGKKVQVLSLEELERNHYKSRHGNFWCSKKEYSKNVHNTYGDPISWLRYEDCLTSLMQKLCGKICEVSDVGESFFRLKDQGDNWHLWMVKEPISIEDILKEA